MRVSFWNRDTSRNLVRPQEREQVSSGEWVERIWDTSILDAEYFVVDIETSGFVAETDSVLSLAAGILRMSQDDFAINQYDLVLQSNVDAVPEFIWELTGLTPDALASGKPLKEVLFRALQLSVNRVWIAHHARHELSFLQRHARLFWKLKLRPIAIDTAVVAQALWRLPKVPTLESVCERLEVVVEDRHRADADVIMTAEVWRREAALCQSIGLETVGDVVEWSIAYARG